MGSILGTTAGWGSRPDLRGARADALGVGSCVEPGRLPWQKAAIDTLESTTKLDKLGQPECAVVGVQNN
jgi:hypothetical protein